MAELGLKHWKTFPGQLSCAPDGHGHSETHRLELYSPGALLGTMTLDSLEWRQSSRNQTITSLLAKCPVPDEIPDLTTPRSTLTDRRGEGVSVILDRSERLSGKRPVYELLDQAELKLTIFAADQRYMSNHRESARAPE